MFINQNIVLEETKGKLVNDVTEPTGYALQANIPNFYGRDKSTDPESEV